MPNILEADAMEQLQERGPAHVDEAKTPQPVRVETHIEANRFSVREDSSLREILNAAESQVIQRALEHTGWNRKRAAQLLKISYRGLLYKIRSHSLTKPAAGEWKKANGNGIGETQL
jgi:DNA-binding NtrC family response regulator